MDLQKTRLDNVELRWASLAEPQTRGEYASNKYQVDVVMNADIAKKVKALKNARQVIKDLGDGLYSITLKSTKKPRVQHPDGTLLTVDELKSIGNGTKAYVQVNQYKGYKDAIFLGLSAIRIEELKEYGGEDPFADLPKASDNDDTEAPFDTDGDDDII